MYAAAGALAAAPNGGSLSCTQLFSELARQWIAKQPAAAASTRVTAAAASDGRGDSLDNPAAVVPVRFAAVASLSWVASAGSSAQSGRIRHSALASRCFARAFPARFEHGVAQSPPQPPKATRRVTRCAEPMAATAWRRRCRSLAQQAKAALDQSPPRALHVIIL
ncbi:hypothetical protein PHYPSEUDO_005534 [Phytophthora pseudosyringae]|uniref:Uncharacterized protein n=1 Tax=Phytophthora pseudosyringae TaxID=221518 RepID=A0A8T1WGS5_9STRA|nr:hypothetical protein PHYPSEUDO_005534 [Phytophthora pseudosyringae]